jgi:hypothetical protein
VNASGYPILSTEQTFFTDNGFFAGATIDPLTGDLLTPTGGLLYDIQGFAAPIQPTNFTASASGNWNDSNSLDTQWGAERKQQHRKPYPAG